MTNTFVIELNEILAPGTHSFDFLSQFYNSGKKRSIWLNGAIGLSPDVSFDLFLGNIDRAGIISKSYRPELTENIYTYLSGNGGPVMFSMSETILNQMFSVNGNPFKIGNNTSIAPLQLGCEFKITNSTLVDKEYNIMMVFSIVDKMDFF